jgi:hypothetical protein
MVTRDPGSARAAAAAGFVFAIVALCWFDRHSHARLGLPRPSGAASVLFTLRVFCGVLDLVDVFYNVVAKFLLVCVVLPEQRENAQQSLVQQAFTLLTTCMACAINYSGNLQ